MTDRAATTGQISFLRDLVREMRGEEAVEQAVAWAWGAGFDATSQQIDRLKAERAAKRRVSDTALLNRLSVKTWEPAEPGLYMYDEVPYQIISSPYARNPFGLTVKMLDSETGGWATTSGWMLRTLRPQHKMTLNQAVAYGRATSRCAACGRLLTDAASVEIGVGPVCRRTRF